MRTIASITAFAFAFSAAEAQKPASLKASTRTEERGWPLDMDGMIRVHNFNGSVTITGWDKDSVALHSVVTGTSAMGMALPSLFGGGSRRGVKAGLDGGTSAAAPTADFVMFVPSRARLSVRGAATTIEIKNFAGTVDVSTLGGRIKIAGSVTEVTAETMDGDLEIESSPSYLRGKTATGRITWTGSSDDVALSTVSGTIAMTSGGTLYRSRVESISGDIKFTGAVKAGGHTSFDSHGGDVTLSFSKDTYADLTMEAPITRAIGMTGFDSPAKDGKLHTAALMIPRAGSRGNTAPADILARSFKGRVTVTQP